MYIKVLEVIRTQCLGKCSFLILVARNWPIANACDASNEDVA